MTSRWFGIGLTFVALGIGGCGPEEKRIDTPVPAKTETSTAKPASVASEPQSPAPTSSAADAKTAVEAKLDKKSVEKEIKIEEKHGVVEERELPLGNARPDRDSGQTAQGRAGARPSRPHAERGRSGEQPFDRGEIRTGQAALFQRADFEGRHRQLRDLPQSRKRLDRPNAHLGGDQRPTRQSQRADGFEHRVRQVDVLGRPRAFA